MNRKIDALIALSQDRATSRPERALAAQHAARMLTAAGRNYLEVYPYGLPE